MLINQKLRIIDHSLRMWLLNRNHQILWVLCFLLFCVELTVPEEKRCALPFSKFLSDTNVWLERMTIMEAKLEELIACYYY